MQLFKQDDPQWAHELLGFGNVTTIAQGGCTISCIGYLHNLLTGDNLNPYQVNMRLKLAFAFQGSLLLWSRIQMAFPELRFVTRDYNYNNLKVWSWINISPRLPVLVENRMPTGSHWRVFIGNQKCYNPLTGTIEKTSIYPILTGSARFTR